jgi:hypothetical protein
MTSTRISVRCAADPALAGPRFSSDLLARLVAEPRSPVRVAVPMMKIRIARMRVDHRLMPVPMRMRLRDPPKMLVLVMLIMGMAAFVRLFESGRKITPSTKSTCDHCASRISRNRAPVRIKGRIVAAAANGSSLVRRLSGFGACFAPAFDPPTHMAGRWSPPPSMPRRAALD